MIIQMKMGLIALVGIVIWGFTPGVVHAAKTHLSNCNECHKSSAVSPRSMGNLCVDCHAKTKTTTAARFAVGDSSNAMWHNASPGTISGSETSHSWGGSPTKWDAAGSANPASTFYFSRYSISSKRITCTICHDPHGEAGANKLVRAAIAGDLVCQQCHSSWFIVNDSNDANPLNDTNALLTHPIVADYLSFAATNPTNYNATPLNPGSGDVRLVNNGVSCTSCHGTHYADSSSGTADSATSYNSDDIELMARGDGNLLRSDGPLRMTGTPEIPGPRNGTTGTAQLRSNLCQACHKIELHGQGLSGDHRIGCLDCHGGHAYNGGVPNAYILNKMTPDAVPTRPDRVNGISAQITFNNYPNGASTRITWADENVGGTEGFCEKCHGDVNSVDMVNAAEAHGVADTNECDVCHKHNDPADIYSFNRDASAATCGQCHGFPPYLNVRGDQGNDPDGTGPNPPLGTLGGYAWNYVDLPAYDYVNSTTHEKDEDKTGHMVHAGADLPISPAGADDWYFVGNSGVDNCKVCHGPDAGTTTGNHRIDQPNTFRDLPFDGIAKTGGMSPVYKTDTPNIWTCSNVYCHTNGAPYIEASRDTLTRNYSITNVTPAWDQANGGGFNAIYGNASRCQFCHGNDASSMSSKSNSAVHQAHLGTTTTLNMGIIFDCKTCHVNTASSSTALKAGAMDGRQGIGKHVNGTIEVDFETGVTPNTLPEALSDSTYTAATGECSTYCHNVTGAGGAMAADWDVTTDMQCDSCHGGLATDISGNGGYGAITTGSHGRHIITSGNGPKLLCAECHGSGSDAGTHAGHFDGLINIKVAVDTATFGSDSISVCKECHGYDGDAGEVLPVWGAPSTTDCATCHAGAQCGADFNGHIVVTVDYARTSGHNRPTSAGPYPQSNNVAANSACDTCHITDSAYHWNGTTGTLNDLMLRTDDSFPATYTGNEDAFCGNCHGSTPASVKAASVATRNINTHQGKKCIACHNVHGDQNIQMIWLSQADQVSHDPSATGKYASNVLFSNLTNFGADSYDEDDGAIGGVGENNSDDICATCHTVAAGTAHNNANNSTGDHYQGQDCFTCHAPHNDPSDAFKLGAGTACNDCHGYPPRTSGQFPTTSAKAGAHGDGTNLHSRVASSDRTTEDVTDCAYCHTGADQYTYDVGADQLAGGIRGNHGKGLANRLTVLSNVVSSVGYNQADGSCSNACHASSAADGSWTDTTAEGNSGNGLNCSACHFYKAAPTIGDVPSGLTVSHDEHFASGKTCSACHTMTGDYNNGVAHVGPLTHIHVTSFGSGDDGNDGTVLLDMATASQNEAGAGALGVIRTSMTFTAGVADASGTNNRCSGGITTGCHASGTPDWDVVIPATDAGCVACHTDTTTAAFNPTSGLHGNSPAPTVTGEAHDNSFNSAASGCITCHTTTPSGSHIDGNLDSGAAVTVDAIAGYVVGTADCATTCHTAGVTWRYKWTKDVYASDNVKECNGCHGMYSSITNSTGWTTGTIHAQSGYETRGSKHTNTGTSPHLCDDCHAVGSTGYTFAPWKSNKHGDNLLQLNSEVGNGWAFGGGEAGCALSCHSNPSDHNFPDPGKFTVGYVVGNTAAVPCFNCHGGSLSGDNGNYWPDGLNTKNDNLSEDNTGAHAKHIQALAASVYNETATGAATNDILRNNTTNNPGLTSDAKQQILCSYCHGTLGGNPINVDHGATTDLPAEVNSMSRLWAQTADNGVYIGGATATCSSVDCHNNKTTPTTNDWYDAPGNGNCAMCHLDVTADTAHTKHTGAAGTFGMNIVCADCHQAATTTTFAPASGHLDGTFLVDQGAYIDGTTHQYTGYTYPSVKGTCGTNDCHEDGKGGAPVNNSYLWGATLADCTICHAGTPATGTHVVHVNNSSYVPNSCDDCHTTASNGAHIGGSVTYNTAKIPTVAGTSPNITCTNTCHSGAAAEFDGTPGLACTDCHNSAGGGFIGDGANYQDSGLHGNSPAPTVTGEAHDDSFNSGSTCVTCHTSTPTVVATNHINGSLNSGAAITFHAIAGYTVATADCATTCHTAGVDWRYKWTKDAYASDNVKECNGCHGMYSGITNSTGWTTGTIHAQSGYENRGSKHSSLGTSPYPCDDCHSVGSVGYTFAPWKSNKHGDNFLQLNSEIGNGWAFGAGLAGCADSCHSNPADHSFLDPGKFTVGYVAGNTADVPCSGCHGGSLSGDIGNYWPDGLNTKNDNLSEDNSGAHAKHIQALAKAVYNETATGAATNDILRNNTTNNPGLASDTKQQIICSYCHGTLGGNPISGDHGATTDLPTEVNSMSRLWAQTADNGVYIGGVTATCSSIDCHNNKTTPTTNDWYDLPGNGNCAMCHLDVTTDTAHTKHTAAFGTFGMTIDCADCHQAATTTTFAPANSHIDGTFKVDQGTYIDGTTYQYSGYTYPGVKGTCGTNDCHEDGKGGAPVDNSYLWGANLGDCTICHAGTPATSTHVVHVNNSSYVPNSCDDCHTLIGSGSHIDNSVNYNTTIIPTVAGTTPNITCTNSCHTGAAAQFDGTPGLACTDCHSSTYIGIAAMPQYSMHTLVPTVSGVVHDATVPGAGGDCAFCHDSMPAPGGSHIDGTTEGNLPNNTDRGMFAGFTDAATPTCTTACHSAGTSWAYKWSATVTDTLGGECANCHGDYNSGWNTGVGHAVISGRGNVGAHVDTGSLTYECTACHVIGASTNNYLWTTETNDWQPNTSELQTTLHGDGNINVNNTGATPTRSTNAGCQGCHTVPDASHSFPISSWTLVGVAGDPPAGSSACNTCHHDGGAGTNPWPTDDGLFPYQGGGKHVEHVTAIALAKSIAPDATCVYCHLDPGGASHETNNAPAAADVTGIKNLMTGLADGNASISGQGTNVVHCSSVDCHFNNTVTPHWYDDNTAPDVRALTAVQGPEPRSIEVSWLAPGDDAGVDNTTAYVYDMRYSVNDGGADATNFASTTNHVGGLPATYNRGFASSVVAENLTPGATYYFSLRTRDTAGNWSAGSAPSAGVIPTVDAQAPDFGGANKAIKGDEGAAINVYWTPAEDHTMPITYKIWMTAAGAGSGTNGDLKMGDGTLGTDAPIITGWLDSKIELENGGIYNGFGPITVTNDTIYNIGVRACDALGKCDTNTQVVSATPTAVPLVAKTYHTYRTSGSLTLVKDGTAGTAVTAQALPKVFAPGTNNTYSVISYVDAFSVYCNNTANSIATVRATLGTTTNGTNFTPIATYPAGIWKEVTVGKRTGRVFAFKFGDVTGRTIPSGQRYAIEVREVTALNATISYGDAVNRGDATVAERIVNVAPSAVTNNGTTGVGVGDAIVEIAWNAATDTTDGVSDTVHYDLYGSNNGGTSYPFVIKEGLTSLSYTWDTQSAGITGGNIAVRINAGDGYAHSTTNITGLGTADSSDYVAPSPIDDLTAKKRPKAGTVWLTWTAPGDDYHNHGRADHYDIRYSTAPITEGNFASATEVTGEPYPDFGGEIQHYEVTGLVAGTNYYFAIKTYDENGNGSAISTAKGGGDTTQVGGPRCGMCHTTAPSVDESVGNHKLHGFTLNDCDKCHSPAADSGLANLAPPSSYGLDHQDGKLVMGYGTAGAYEGFIAGNRVYYTVDGTSGGAVLYDDIDGFGGFGDGTYTPKGDNTDSGTCINFGTRLIGACHGSAGGDPDGGGPLTTYETPTWNAEAVLNCAACHGNKNRTDDLYGVPFDATSANAGIVTDQIKGSPAVDNHGNYAADGTGTEGQRMFIGQHEKHLNYSFRFSKGDSCNLCHPGKYASKTNIDGRHANGEIEVELDLNAAGDNAVWTKGDTSDPDPANWTAGSCGSMSPESCHPTTSTPKWDTAQSFDCVGCHGMAGITPDHVTDPGKNINLPDNDPESGPVADRMQGNCTWCHFPGHPTDDLGGAAIILPNSSQVGINYKSGGIHLRRVIGGRASAATEAQLCWGCHDQNGNGSLNDAGDISEWGQDTGNNNTATRPANLSNYNYGTLNQPNWVGASWTSGDPNFGYKTGKIQSTHSTNETGTSALTGSAYNYFETKDTVDKIRCSNCHDVHNLNKAPGDNPGKLAALDAPPYLRGTWVRNPYPEDGAPWNKVYAAPNKYGPVPRGSNTENSQGGYQIDQNNNSPTAGLSLATSAGICTLCHGTDVDNMDKTSENLWMTTGRNGHSNATLGGTADPLKTTNIFGDGQFGRGTPTGAGLLNGAHDVTDVPNMAMAYVLENGTATSRVYSYRSTRAPQLNPKISADYAFLDYNWGATVDNSTIDVGYHAFTCSKCHNPHASRLPKLMITNCLDTRQNTWDDVQGSLQSVWTSATDNGERTATHTTAQNCHRYDRGDNIGGWNKVTPWLTTPP